MARLAPRLARPVLLAALAALAAACSEPPRHLLLVTVDTLRADHLGVYGYPRDTSPRLDALAKDAVVFENAAVQYPVTTPSLVSLFSATYPHVNGVVSTAGFQWVADQLVLLPEVLAEQGFRTRGVVSNGVVGRDSNFPQGFEVYVEMWREPAPPGVAVKSASRVTDAALAQLAELAAGGDRFFLWVHYIDPHDPYEPPPGYAERFLGDAHHASRRVPLNPDESYWKGIPRTDWERAGGEDDLADYVARYDGEIRYTDEQVGRLLDGLPELGLADRTLVAFTSDHGESLGEHDYYFNHGHLAYEEQLRVPLLLVWPGGRHAGTRIEAPVELRWLAPTLLEALGLPRAFDAPSLLPAIRGEDAVPPVVRSEAGSAATLLHHRHTLAIRKGTTKLVLNRSEWAEEIAGGREALLFDLHSDPAELRDLAPLQPQQVAGLRRELESWFETSLFHRIAEPRAPPRVRPDTLEQLRELGYLR